jgi:hypothetical protein
VCRDSVRYFDYRERLSDAGPREKSFEFLVSSGVKIARLVFSGLASKERTRNLRHPSGNSLLGQWECGGKEVLRLRSSDGSLRSG